MGVNAMSMHVHRRGLAPPPRRVSTGVSHAIVGSARPGSARSSPGRPTRLVRCWRGSSNLYDWAPQDRIRKRSRGFLPGFLTAPRLCSMVEQWAFNPLVQGSSPWGRTERRKRARPDRVVPAAVRCRTGRLGARLPLRRDRRVRPGHDPVARRRTTPVHRSGRSPSPSARRRGRRRGLGRRVRG